MLILGLSKQDAGSVSELLQKWRSSVPENVQGWVSDWSLSAIEAQVERGGCFGLWMELEQGGSRQLLSFLLAQMIAEPNAPELEILLLLTDPEASRKGLARELLQGLFQRRSFRRVLLEVHENNDPARRFYDKLGFVQVGSRSNYYVDGASALLLDVSGKELAGRLGL